MNFVEQGIGWLQQLSPFWVLAFMFFVAYIENVFPPSPSDVVLIFAGTMIGVGTVGFASSLLVSTLGSTLGFLTAYLVGRYFQSSIVDGRFSRWLPVNTIQQVEGLFQRYGYGVIVANRFLAGTRAIVSFFAGMSKMNLPVTTALCAISALAWNAILLYLGKIFAGNWRKAAEYLELYSKAATVIVLLLLALFAWRFYKNRKATATSN
ncbi:MAG: DedA family protein [Acidobacteria bacterium]|nr:DedA family protein [Acidobacteriota bacterium]MBI3425091.1 DedA family protein [Acidobacteriota bacterium]